MRKAILKPLISWQTMEFRIWVRWLRGTVTYTILTKIIILVQWFVISLSYLAQVIGPHRGMVQRFTYSEVVLPKTRCQFCCLNSWPEGGKLARHRYLRRLLPRTLLPLCWDVDLIGWSDGPIHSCFEKMGIFALIICLVKTGFEKRGTNTK